MEAATIGVAYPARPGRGVFVIGRDLAGKQTWLADIV
jgi:hypothetical protein